MQGFAVIFILDLPDIDITLYSASQLCENHHAYTYLSESEVPITINAGPGRRLTDKVIDIIIGKARKMAQIAPYCRQIIYHVLGNKNYLCIISTHRYQNPKIES